MAKVPAGSVAAYSDGMECPGCKTRLEVSPASRMLATALGLAAGALVYRLTRGSSAGLAWALPVLYGFLAYGVVSPLYLMLTADLRLAREQPAAEPAPVAAGHGHGGGHH